MTQIKARRQRASTKNHYSKDTIPPTEKQSGWGLRAARKNLGQKISRRLVPYSTAYWQLASIYRRAVWQIQHGPMAAIATSWRCLETAVALAAPIAENMDLWSDAVALRRCGQYYQVGQRADGDEVIEAVYLCHNRLCPNCRVVRAEAWKEKITQWLAQGVMRLDGRGYFFDPDAAKKLRKLDYRVWDISTRRGLDEAEKFAALLRIISTYEKAMEIHKFINQVGLTPVSASAQAQKLYPLFITLTIPNVPHLLNADGTSKIRELIFEPLRKMRETARRRPNSQAGRFWRHIKGGIWTFEVTHNAARQDFHPHVHMLVLSDVPFLHREALKKMWSHYTGTTVRQIDIRRAEKDRPLGDLVKYIAKPLKNHQGPAWREIARATKDRLRMINTFGCFRNLPKAPELIENIPIEVRTTADGVHLRVGWDGFNQQYRVVKSWAASETDPIIPMRLRLEYGAEQAHLHQLEARQASQSDWPIRAG